MSSSDDTYTLANLGFSFSYFGSIYSLVSISINGYVCLGSNSKCGSIQRPTPYDILVGWNADLKTSRNNSGQIYYHSLTQGSTYFTQAQAYVNKSDSSFVAKNVFMITYDRVLPYDVACSDPTSFQVFLSTDGIKNYVTFSFTTCPTCLPILFSSGLNQITSGNVFRELSTFSNGCTSTNVGQTKLWVMNTGSVTGKTPIRLRRN